MFSPAPGSCLSARLDLLWLGLLKNVCGQSSKGVKIKKQKILINWSVRMFLGMT